MRSLLQTVLFAAAAFGSVLLAGCATPDPKAELVVEDLDPYWAVDPAKAGTQYIAPALQFHVRNTGQAEQRSVHANVVFHRVGEENQTWGSGFWAQDYPRGKALAPGQTMLIAIQSDARYTSQVAEPQAMFDHASFKDVKYDLFLRLGSSPWIKFSEGVVPRRIGAMGVQSEVPVASPSAIPSPSASAAKAPSAPAKTPSPRPR